MIAELNKIMLPDVEEKTEETFSDYHRLNQ